MLFRAYASDELLTWMRLAELIGQIQAVHGILGIEHRAIVFRGNFGGRKFIGQGCPAHEQRHTNACRIQILRCHHHLLRRFDQ